MEERINSCVKGGWEYGRIEDYPPQRAYSSVIEHPIPIQTEQSIPVQIEQSFFKP